MRAERAGAAIAAVVASLSISAPALAAEGASLAGPIGGTDMRSAMLPPPGLYGGLAGVASDVTKLLDGSGNPVPGLDAVNLKIRVGGPFLLYVPDVQVLGGTIGLFGVLPAGTVCGQLVSTVPYRCISGMGDPYFEVMWSRSFGHVRAPTVPGAFPIVEGLTVEVGLGTLLPLGHYDAQLQQSNGATVGNNTFDVAPTFAVSYTTPPLLFDGTEFSSKLFWNNYATNPETHYKTGTLIDIDFALTEHIGRFQVGAAGFYAFQVEDDRQFGMPVAADGRRIKELALGGIVNCDLAEIGAAIRAKYAWSAFVRNSVVAHGIVVTFGKKLF